MMRAHRTAIVISLLAIAVLLPSGAWWLSGSHEAARKADLLGQEAFNTILREATDSAAGLNTDLEAIREAEARRPFYHYQNLTHEPRGATEGLSIIPSPLAAGVADPLIGAYFQVDPQGRVSLPTVNEDFPELSTEEGYAMYCALLEDLEASFVVGAVTEISGAMPSIAAGEEHRLNDPNQGYIVRLSASQWQQIVQANEVYALLSGRRERPPLATIDTSAGGEDIAIPVGPLQWHTILVGGRTVLAALRRVETPRGVVVQGFTINDAAIAQRLAENQTLHSAADPDPAASGFVVVPVGATGWVVAADAAVAAENAAFAGQVVINRFRRTFFLSFGAALLAAGFAALIVVQTNRLAHQRTRFAAMAAHELKTPLSTLHLYSEMLAENLGEPRHREQYARRINNEVGRLGRVVVNVLDLSRLERGAELVQPSIGDLMAVIDRCVGAMRRPIEDAGMAVHLRRPDTMPKARFDADAVCQILTNVLDNAERYTRAVEDRSVDISVELEGDRARVLIADNGPGLSKRARAALFKPFSRGTSAGDPAGLGLGLPIARSLARAMGGDLQHLPADRGATFCLTLPIDPED